MYCRNCGAPLADNAVVCARCGATVTPPAPPPGAQQPYQNQQPPYQNPYYQNAYGQQPYQPPYQQQEDRPSAGFNALAFFLSHRRPDPLPCLEESKTALCARHWEMGADWFCCQYCAHDYRDRTFRFVLQRGRALLL
ncbi:MAG: zinc-ribbon domain-containing protein [Clostridiales bacterium]|nr:zinc-ribbon domain-containing protein [Clostridiales bacterium]